MILGSLHLSGKEAGQTALALMTDLKDPSSGAEVVGRLGISKFCGPRKRAVIREHWEGRASWVAGEGYSFQLLEEKVEGDLAGVLIGATTPNNPELATVIPLALVRQKEGWKVAPVEGSFENTGIGFAEEVRSEARALEGWMSQTRVRTASALQSAELRKFKEAMDGAVPEEDLRNHGPREALESFIKATEAGDTKAAIVWQGYLERNEFPDVDWQGLLRITRVGIKGRDRQRTWRLLTSQKVMKVVLDDGVEDPFKEGGGELLVGFLSAFETGTMNDHLNPVRFAMKKTKAGWRVGLPVFFALANEESRAFRNARNRDFNWEDRSGIRRVFRAFEARHLQIVEEEAKAVVTGVLNDLAAADLTTFLRRHYRYDEKKKKEGKDGEQVEEDGPQFLRGRIGRGRGGNEGDKKRLESYLEAVKWWAEVLGDRSQTEAEMSAFFMEDRMALAILSLPSSSDTWKPVYGKLWLRRSDEGWMILPGRESPLWQSFPEEEKKAVAALNERYEVEQERISENFLQDVLKVVALDSSKGEAAGEEEATAIVREWRRVAKTGGMLALLKLSAVRQRPEEAKILLRDVSYLRKGAASAGEPDEILGTQASRRFRAISLGSVIGAGNEMSFPLLIVVPVEGGYRVLVDIELPLETNRGISLLNEDRMEELSEELSEEDFASIKELRKWHQETAGPVWEKWKKEQEVLNR